eukprot:m.310436 g.310436  ORF g.310436 m.310436 type:complete len:402 (+) comp51623_c0_seq1:135-1340(+)
MAERRPRVKSAHARLVTTSSDDAAVPYIDYSRTNRVKSANQLKRQHQASHFVFPEPSASNAWQATSYGEHFARKFGRPATARPTSPTRRNKPHPAQRFMTWTLPTMMIDHPRAVGPSDDTLADTIERFYDDYTGDRNVGDSKAEVLTQLTNVPFPGASLKEEREARELKLISGLTGTQIASNKTGTLPTEKTPRKKQAQELIGRTIKASASSALKRWIEKATDEERDTVLRMLNTSGSEEQRMQTLLDVVRPDIMPGVENWMKTAGDADKAVVYKMIQSLSGAKELTKASTDRRMMSNMRRAKQSNALRSRHIPAATYPHVQVSELPYFVGDDYNRWMYAMETGREIPIHRPVVKRNPDVLWHHKVQRDAAPSTFNRGSLFAAANKYPAQHFAIIPEWPIA